MRDSSIGASFDVVGREALIIKFYEHADISTIDDATDPGVYYYNHEFFVTPMQPENHDLDIQWFVDGTPISGANGTTFNPGSLGLAIDEEYTIRVEVVDNTTMVRDEDAREDFMTDSKEWTFRRILQVTTEADENGTNPAAMSFREALALAANETTHPGSNMIIFAPGVEEILLDQQLVIGSDVEIVGPGSELLIIDGQYNDRVFYVGSGVEATISGLTITGGGDVSQGGGIYSYYSDLTLDGVRITANETYLSGSVNGGGIYSNGGSLHMFESTVDNNQSRWGGGLQVTVDDSSDIMEIVGSSIYDNYALISGNDGLGGGLLIQSGAVGADLSIVNSTISGNTAGDSAGIRVEWVANLSVVNSTIAYNEAVNGVNGGIMVVDSGRAIAPCWVIWHD